MPNSRLGSRTRRSGTTFSLDSLLTKRGITTLSCSVNLREISRYFNAEISQRLERKESRYQEARRHEYHWQEQSMLIETSY